MTQTETTHTKLFTDLPAPIAKALVDRGFTALTAVQRAVVEAEHAGRDLRISSQTGSGKTIAIGLALATHFLERPAQAPDGPRRGGDGMAHPRALVIVPTRELAAQVREELRWLFAEVPGATVEVVTGGVSILRERIALARRPAFVVGTPGRLLDHMRNAALACDAIEHVILDEADQMLDMGFKDELDEILEQLPEKRSSHLVSATFPQAVKALADRFQRDAMTLEGTKLGAANPDIQHVAYTIRRHETYAALVNVLLLAGDSRCLLFVNRRIDATELAEKLAADGFGAAPFSGELPQAQRTRTLAAFKSGLLPILVSTDVAARGIDVPEIGTVIHVDPPKNPDAYVHRSGRTGRAGRAGRSILLVEAAAARKVGRMLQSTRIPIDWQRVPGPETVERALTKQAQKILFAKLDESSPTEAQRLDAKQLLVERDPIEIVAALLEIAKPQPPRAPMDVVGVDPYVDEGRGRKGRDRDRDRRDVRDTRDERGPRAPHFERGERPPRGERPAPGSFTPFHVSWGDQGGATTARILSHVCRRGELDSRQIGAIRIFAKSALVEVANDVADAFASRASRPDDRDPGITIERARGDRPPRPAPGRPHASPKRFPGGERAGRSFGAGGPRPGARDEATEAVLPPVIGERRPFADFEAGGEATFEPVSTVARDAETEAAHEPAREPRSESASDSSEQSANESANESAMESSVESATAAASDGKPEWKSTWKVGKKAERKAAKKSGMPPIFKARQVRNAEDEPIVERDASAPRAFEFDARPARSSAPKHQRKPRTGSGFEAGAGPRPVKGPPRGPARGSSAGPAGRPAGRPGGRPEKGAPRGPWRGSDRPDARSGPREARNGPRDARSGPRDASRGPRDASRGPREAGRGPRDARARSGPKGPRKSGPGGPPARGRR